MGATIGLSFGFISAPEAQFVLGAISAEGSLSDSENGFAWTFAIALSSSSDGRTASEISGNFNGEQFEETVADVDGSTVATIGLSFGFISAPEAQFVLGAISAEGSLSGWLRLDFCSAFGQ